MKKETIALEIEIKRQRTKEVFCFNDTMVHAILSGLSAVYDEVFIWTAGKHLAVWAVGTNPELLVNAFEYHRVQYKKMQLTEGVEALDLFENILQGKIWDDVDAVTRLGTLYQAYDLASEFKSIGPNLEPIVLKGISKSKSDPTITGARNSWVKSPVEIANDFIKKAGLVRIKSDDLFYRFSVN